MSSRQHPPEAWNSLLGSLLVISAVPSGSAILIRSPTFNSFTSLVAMWPSFLLPLCAVVALLSSSVSAAEYRWRVLSVLDGDSLKVDLPGLPPELSPITVRIRGIDAPEAGSKARCDAERERADRATAMLAALLRGGTPVFSSPEWDKYGGRILATVTVNGENVADRLIAAHLARAYDGQGARQGWCP